MTARVVVAVVGCVLALAGSVHAQAPADPHAGHVMPTTGNRQPATGDRQPASSQPSDGPLGERALPATARTGDGGLGERAVPAPGQGTTTGQLLPPFIPPVTDEMRAAAFPDVHGHAAHDRLVNGFVLFDQLEWRSGHGPGGLSWSNAGWVGGDINRLWFRTEGDGTDDGLDDAQAHVLYGRAVARWWDVVAGVRQDFQPGAQTWLAVGVQGLAPGFFEVQATAYLSDEGQTAAQVEVEYDLLITNRLVLQPMVEVQFYGKPNASLGVGSGLSSGEAGIRLRYHITREFAPYVGVSWVRAFGDMADLAHHEDVPNGAPRFVTGLRVWF